MITQSNNLKQQFKKRIPFYYPIPSKRIKKLKNKGELSLGEHNRKNILVDTDSEESISFKESKKIIIKKELRNY